ncbi:MAG: cation-translocating P-type ATPase, partial [Planctomycetota bacterium]
MAAPKQQSPTTNAASTHVNLDIGGMTCASCVSRVERVVQAVPGVRAASVNLMTERAQLTLAPEADPQAILEAVNSAGFSAAWTTDTPPQGHPSQDAQRSQQQRRMLWVAGLCTAPIFVLDMSGHMLPVVHHLIGGWWLHVLFMVLASIVQFGPGWQFYRRGLPSLWHGAPDMNALVMLGTTAAYG